MNATNNRCKLWKAIDLPSDEMEDVFHRAKQAVVNRVVLPQERPAWATKTQHLMHLFDFCGVPRPVGVHPDCKPRASTLAGYAALWDVLAEKADIMSLINFKDNARGIDKESLMDALSRLGEYAHESGKTIKLIVFGGAAMVLAYSARITTKDIDAAIIYPGDKSLVRKMVERIAVEKGWPDNWLNEQVKAYLYRVSEGKVVFTAPGIQVLVPDPEQLLAMKLSAWRDRLDRADARRVLYEISAGKNDEEVWDMVRPFIPWGKEKSSRAHFDELWKLHPHDNA